MILLSCFIKLQINDSKQIAKKIISVMKLVKDVENN